MKNYNCDKDKCTKSDGEVRMLLLNGGARLDVCFDCFQHEMEWRKLENRRLSKDNQWKIPKWEDLIIGGYIKKEPEMFHRADGLKGGPSWANFDPKKHICPPGYTVFRYYWKHFPTGKTGESFLITEQRETFEYLLKFWKVTGQWEYTEIKPY